ncbi:hypothetical protein J2X46_002805 [Nocardioides sp. BE266]|uniref:hypothetical protein n=1 Tax=Nocardioides sp. BE266 TaxID=2817725 RepID=UPI0028664CA9|nr:hypothetical protein [Nocardioides sp. BE266]MDR7253815.1 hypothetical protein [Nocardioides sp. BE266]
MTKKKQYKKKLPTVLPPAPRPASDAEVPQAEVPQAEVPPTAPALPTPRPPEPRPAVSQSTADFVREMKQRAGVRETAPVLDPDLDTDDDAADDTDDEHDEDHEQEVEVQEPYDEPYEEAILAYDEPYEDEPERSRRPVLPLVLVGVLLIGIAAGALAYWWTARDDGSQQAGSGWSAPAGLKADEGYVETRVHADGSMEVRQWIHADEPIDRVTLRVPHVSSAGQLAAEDVEVLADGTPVAGQDEITYFTAAYDLGGATEVELRYRLVGAIQRSDSAAGRALAVVTGLEARFSPAPAREVRVVKAPEVLSLACAPVADGSPVPCGKPDGDGEWHVDLSGARTTDRVLASVTVG